MRFGVLLFSLMAATPAAMPAQTTVTAMLTEVRAALRQHKTDSDVARMVAAYKLTENLPDAVVEQLESEGAGAETMARLEWQQIGALKRPLPSALPQLFDTPPEPSNDQQKVVLAKAREWALQFTSSLPDFIATETVSRSTAKRGSQFWKPQDTLTVSVAFSQKAGERYKLLAINGKATTKNLDAAGGFKAHGEFGTIVQFVFQPATKTQFKWERWALLHGRLSYVFSYKVDEAHSSYNLNLERRHATSSMKGYVYLDRDTLKTMRVSAEADGLPAGWGDIETLTMVDFDYAEVAGERHLLPRRLYSRLMQGEVRQRNETELTNYRKFSAEATVTFGR